MSNNPINNPLVKDFDGAVDAFSSISDKLPTERFEKLQLLSEINGVVSKLNGLFGDVFNTLSGALPGATLKSKIEKNQNDLADLNDEIQEKTKLLEDLEKIEKENREAIAKKSELEEELKNKQDLAAFDPSIIDNLKEKIKQFDIDKPWIKDLQNLQKTARETITEKVLLTTKEADLLAENIVENIEQYNKNLEVIRQELTQHQKIKAELDAKIKGVRDQLAQTKKEIKEKENAYQKDEEELRRKVADLEAYIEADRKIAEAINNSEARTVKQNLEEIEKQLDALNQQLKAAIESNQENKAARNITF